MKKQIVPTGLILLGAAAFLCSCATDSPSKIPVRGGELYNAHYRVEFSSGLTEPPQEVFQSYQCAQDRVWSSTIAVIRELGWPILLADERDGIITTDWFERQSGPCFMGSPTGSFRDRLSVGVATSNFG